MVLPRNVQLFAALLYASLGLDALSVAFQDRTPSGQITDGVIMMAHLIAAALIMVLVYLVRLAAEERRRWPRTLLVVSLVLSVLSLIQIVGDAGLQFDSAIELVSCALTGAGLYYAFTGDAKGWFNR
uniref:Transmembrane protein n=1 Tax=Rhodopseudomonas palustris (strain BisA53) TaxID=316055 RepID=Q07M77_RHOP5